MIKRIFILFISMLYILSITPALAFGSECAYVTGRVKVEPDDWMLEFRLKICGAYRWLQLALSVKKAFLRSIFGKVRIDDETICDKSL